MLSESARTLISQAGRGDVTMRGRRLDGHTGGSAVSVAQRVGDPAVASTGVQRRRDSGGGGDRDAAGVGAQLDRAGGGLGDGDSDVALTVPDLRRTGQT